MMRVSPNFFQNLTAAQLTVCLLYTSDAADERSSVDLGGRRIIKKKKKRTTDAGRTYQQKNIESEMRE